MTTAAAVTNATKVLEYYHREADREDPRVERGWPAREREPLAGLTIEAFRAARQTLIARGDLVRTKEGRYRPTRR